MKTERQQEILEVALELINQKGIQGFTLKNLSKEIGISEPAIYRHYESKIQILTTLLDVFKESIHQIYEKEFDARLTAPEKVAHLFIKHLEHFAGNPSMVSLIFSEEVFRGEPLLIKKITQVIEKNASILTQIISQGQHNKEIRGDVDAGHLALMVMGTLRLFVKKWQLSGYAFDIQSEGQKVLDSVRLVMAKH